MIKPFDGGAKIGQRGDWRAVDGMNRVPYLHVDELRLAFPRFRRHDQAVLAPQLRELRRLPERRCASRAVRAGR
jgi:hypothetical protein